MNMKKTIRESYIDAIRIFAITSVVLLHCISTYFSNASLLGTKTWWAVNIINSMIRFGVPLFFMISGYLLLDTGKVESVKDFLQKRLPKILIPFIIWSAIYYIYFQRNTGQPIRLYIYGYINL